MIAGRRGGWLGPLTAGLVLGGPLALAGADWFVRLTPSGPSQYQVAMWLTAGLWLAVLAASLGFDRAGRAWLWLGGATLLAHGLPYLSLVPLW